MVGKVLMDTQSNMLWRKNKPEHLLKERQAMVYR